MKKQAILLFLVIAFGLAGCASQDTGESSQSTKMNTEQELDTEPGFDDFLGQFKELTLPRKVGAKDFEDEKAFPSSPELENGSPQAVELVLRHGSDDGIALIPIGRVLPEHEVVFLLLLKSGLDYQRIFLLAYSRGGQLKAETEIANCYMNGEYQVAEIRASGCIMVAGEFLSLMDDESDEIENKGMQKYMRIGADGTLEEVPKCN